MKRKLSIFFCIFSLFVSIFAVTVIGKTFETDKLGQYTVTLPMEANNEYILIVLKGKYNQTNYIEAYNNAKDSDIIYFEQKASDENGNVTFGPFVPNGYYDATLVVGGTNLEEPYLAGHLSVVGVSNEADIEISGVESSYTVSGISGKDYFINVETEVFDSFGYPSVTNQEVSIELAGNLDGVSIDGNVISISKLAKAQTFRIVAKVGNASKSVFVEVKRNAPIATRIDVYSDDTFTETVDMYEVIGTQENYPAVTIYAKTLNQYDEWMEDYYKYTYFRDYVDSTFTPKAGDVNLFIESTISDLVKDVCISAKTRPDYKGYALELYNLINEGKEKLSEEKNISEDGEDVFPENTWTNQKNINALITAIEEAEEALSKYNKEEGYSDSDYADETQALSKALSDYKASFQNGTRKDVDSISLKEYDGTIFVNATLTLEAVTSPKIGVGLSNDVLTWTSSDDSVVTVVSTTGNKATIKGVASGTATVTVTTRGGLTASAEITVIRKATAILIFTNSTTAEFRGEPVVLKAQIQPKNDRSDVISWTIDKPELADLTDFNEYFDENGFRIMEATVVPKGAGKVKVTVSAQYGEESATKEITIKMPEWETVTAPVADVESGTILPDTVVSLSSKTPNAEIYYTLDGTTPSRTNGRFYRKPIAISQSLTLKAIAVGNELYDSEIVTYEYKVVSSAVKADSSVARRGDYVDITISVEDFEDIKNAVINVMFDNNALDLTNIDYVCNYVDEDNSTSTDVHSFNIALNNKNEGFSYNGNVATLTFKVKEEAQEGKYPITLTASNIVKMDNTLCDAASFDGAVVVNDYIIGDANDDGAIGLADVLIIKQYLTDDENAKKKILLLAADVDADGDVDNDDVLMLSKYCVGWNVTLGK